MVDIVDIGLSVDSRQVDKGAEALGGLGKAAKKTQKASEKMSAAFKVGVVAAMAASVSVIMKVVAAHREFTKSMSELSSITGATGKDLKFYREQALLLGSSTTFAASEVATAFKLVASAKPELLDSKEALASVTREVLTLAEASGLQLPEAAKALGGALNQFGAGAEEANRYINVLAAGSKYGASEINETAEAMKNVGAVASSVGLSFEETNAAIQALAAVSIKGSEAGTGLRSVLLKLSTQTRDKFNPEIVGLESALKNLRAAGLTTTEMSKIFGQESITAATALINQADSVGELTKKLTGTTTAMDQASVNMDNLDGDIKAMSSAWEGAALLLGNVFDPILRGLTQAATWLGKAMQTLAISLEDTIDLTGALIAVTAALATLDFKSAKAISAARKERSADTQRRIDDIWREKDAEEIKAEAIAKAAESEKARMEEVAVKREEAAIRAAEMRKSERLDRELDMAIDQESELDKIAQHNEAKLQAEKDYYDRLYNMQAGSQEAMYKFSDSLRDGDYKSAVQYGAAALSNAAKNNKGLFEVQKAFSLASATVALPNAVMQSFTRGGGFPWGLIPAGLMLANGLTQINAIKNSTFGGSSSVPSVSSGGGGSAPQAPGLPPGADATPDNLEGQRGTNININMGDDDMPVSKNYVRRMLEGINDEIRDGATIEGITVS